LVRPLALHGAGISSVSAQESLEHVDDLSPDHLVESRQNPDVRAASPVV
jgi:hypothetical protein